jgi:cathepsin B
MMKYLLAFVLVGLAFGLQEPDRLVNNEYFVKYLNSLNLPCTAKAHKKFDGLRLSDIEKRQGVMIEQERVFRAALPKAPTPSTPKDIPTSFDARDKWPQCKNVIGNIRDQSACGSCWAVSSASVMSDRLCIGTNGKSQVSISAGDVMSCCEDCGYGCEGGWPARAFDYFVNTGVVTGGEWHGSGCQPYPLEPCGHHEDHNYPDCQGMYQTPQCQQSCQAGYNVTFPNDKHKGSSAYTIDRDVAKIQQEIMDNGPVDATYQVFSDFYNYQSGVYRHVSGGSVGWHAVRIIGWGEQNGTPYWVVANSWHQDWGMNGYFWIIRGQDECSIESGITAAKA